MAFCSNCGNEIREGVKFCPVCGKEIRSGVSKADSNKHTRKNLKEIIKSETVRDVQEKARQTGNWYVLNWKRLGDGDWKEAGLKHHLAWVGIHVGIIVLLIFAVAGSRMISKVNKSQETSKIVADSADYVDTVLDYSGSNDETDSIKNETELAENTEETSQQKANDIQSEDYRNNEEVDDTEQIPEGRERLSIYNIGDVISFGRYEQDGDFDNGAEDIEWEVLGISGDKALLVSKYILDNMQFSEERTNATWENSIVRKWLNGDFFDKAFNENEKQYIQLTDNENTHDSNWGTYKYNNTSDYVFCLSFKEIKEYYDFDYISYDDDWWYSHRLIVDATPYAVAQGVRVRSITEDDLESWKGLLELEHFKSKFQAAMVSYCENNLGRQGASWWLRSVIKSSDVCIVGGQYGNVGSVYPRSWADYKKGVRPAIWVSIQ